MNGIAASILERIGGTPLVRLRRLARPGSAAVLGKCEQVNPGGSIKDRTALAMIEAAEAQGQLAPGAVVIEATSGNTGIGLALVCAVKGYRLVLTMPENMSPERQALLRAYGAELHLTPAARVMQGAVERAGVLFQRHPGAFMPRQFSNPANAEVHRVRTGVEIAEQLGALVPSALVAGVGTGGTITGVGRALRARFPALRIVAVEPEASAVLSGGEPGPHGIQGIGAGFVPDVLDRSLLSEVRQVADADAEAMRSELARKEGLLVGISSGAAAVVALAVAREQGEGAGPVVTVLPDTGQRYLAVEG